MTPIEIFEYKNKWMRTSPFCVKTHEDFDSDGKQWCRSNLKQHQWNFIHYTDVYEHTFCFEHEDDKNRFEEFLKRK